MYCRNCGKELPDGSKFCTYCGVSQETTVNQETENKPQTVQPEISQNDSKPVGKDKRQKIDLFFKVFFFAAPVVSFLFFFLFVISNRFIVFKILLFLVVALWAVSCFISRKKIKQKNGNLKGAKGFFNTLWSVIAGILVVLIFLLSLIPHSNEESDETTNATVTTTIVTTTEKEETTTEASVEISAMKLVKAYIDNEVKADTMYEDKTVIVSGYVDRISQTDNMFLENELIVYLGSGDSLESCLRCYISMEQKDAVANLSVGDKITVTGRCSGLGSSYFNLKCVDIQDSVISK